MRSRFFLLLFILTENISKRFENNRSSPGGPTPPHSTLHSFTIFLFLEKWRFVSAPQCILFFVYTQKAIISLFFEMLSVLVSVAVHLTNSNTSLLPPSHDWYTFTILSKFETYKELYWKFWSKLEKLRPWFNFL